MKFSRGRSFNVRVLIMLLALLAAWGLYALSRAGDPRFYLFLTTPPGRLLARVFGWSSGLRSELPEKSEADMTAEELTVKYKWEKQLTAEMPLHRLLLNSGPALEGRLIEETPEYVIFEEAYGDGGLTLRFDRKRLEGIQQLARPAHLVSYRDVRFKMEFPKLRFYKRPPFTIAADDKYGRVESAVDELRRLNVNFFELFGSLARRPQMGSSVQVLFLSKGEDFRSYQKRYAPGAENVIGFYALQLDRLVVYHAPHLEDQMLATIRHEGAHQLFYSCGVHSDFHAEHPWLTEGLAVYCETPEPGEVDPLRAKLLQRMAQDNALIPLERLVDEHGPDGLQIFGSLLRVDLAYCQSWALVGMLMQDTYRKDFFRYLEYIRQPGHVNKIAGKRAWEILLRQLALTPEQLQATYREYILNL